MKRTLLLLLTASAVYITMSSNGSGASISKGASAAKDGCGGTGCHGTMATSSVVSTLVFTAKSDGKVVSNGEYSPNETYTVTIGGGNGTAVRMGFMLRASDGSTMQAGTFANPSAGTKVQAIGGFNVVEHSSPITATVGAFTSSVEWTAPAKGSGPITFDLAVNCLNAMSGPDAGDQYKTMANTLTEGPALSVENIEFTSAISVYPNPATDVLNVKLLSNTSTARTYSIMNMSGAVVSKGQFSTNQTSINVAQLAAGMHILIVSDGEHIAQVNFTK